MKAEIFWINNHLAIMPRPRSGDWLEDEIDSLKSEGVTVIVSLLQKDEIEELDLESEESVCKSKNVLFLSFPIIDRQTPHSIQESVKFSHKLKELLENGEKIVIHCRQGIGRSSLIAACLLVLQNVSVEEAFEKISIARNCSVPDTYEQIEWVKYFAGFISEKK
jgi:protein-tyrosine phosphatase